MAVEVVKEMSDSKVKQSYHFHEMLLVLLFFDLLLAHHFELNLHSNIYFLRFDLFYFMNLSFDQQLSPFVQLFLDLLGIVVHLLFEIYQELQIFLVVILSREKIK